MYFTGCIHDELHAVGRQTGFFQRVAQHAHHHTVGMERFFSSAQNHGVARLDAKPGGVAGYIGTSLENNADHAQRHTHFFNAQPIRAH